jgi:hypothetical protein
MYINIYIYIYPEIDMSERKSYIKFIGPSQFGSILGCDQYQSADQLRDYVENGRPSFDSYATQMGRSMEPVALYYYSKLHKVQIQKPKFVVDEKNSHIGGIADGLIGDDDGIEIKCHVNESGLIRSLPDKHLLQIAGYMYLYRRPKWVLMSCVFNPDQTLSQYVVHRVTWSQVEDQWRRVWYPRICEFVDSLKWHSTGKI